MSETHPRNVVKYCPKCGSSQFLSHDDKSFKCGSCGFHLYFNASSAVAVLVADENKRLMLVTRGVEPDYGKLDLPGGFVDPGETAENAVKRELFEELGMKVKSVRYFSSAPNEYIFSGFSVFTTDLAFVAVPERISGLKAMDDILEFRFYAEDELDYGDIAAPSIKKFVRDYFKKKVM